MKTRYFNELPKPYAAYGKIMLSMAKGFAPNQKDRAKPTDLPQAEYIVNDLKIDLSHLKRYNAVCEFTQKDRLPPTYLAVLAQSLQMAMMADEAFPFAIVGLVHIRNQVKQYRPIKPSETLTLACKFGELKGHEKGVQFDFISRATIGSAVVWEGTTTYLVRQKTPAGLVLSELVKVEKLTAQPGDTVENWNIPANIGRRYGLVSGDLNLIHMHPLTAKLFGFQRAIAHGMWTKARCLAAMGELPDAFNVDVQFKLPVLLPANVEFRLHKQATEQFFELNDAKSTKPHLAGQLTVG